MIRRWVQIFYIRMYMMAVNGCVYGKESKFAHFQQYKATPALGTDVYTMYTEFRLTVSMERTSKR